MTDPPIIAKTSNTDLTLLPAMATRHGCITGATGTGKTVTLQVLAEAFAREGVNVFAADIKGDLSGCAAPGAPPPAWAVARAAEINMPLTPEAQPAVFWDVYGELGHPVRTTVTEMGPVLMGRVLEATGARAAVEAMIAERLAIARGALQEIGEQACNPLTETFFSGLLDYLQQRDR